MTIEGRLIRDATVALRAQVVQKVVENLEEMPGQLSGDDSGLASVWEEICVQVQIEQSFSWKAYLETVQAFVAAYVDELPLVMQRILSLGTDVGDEWLDGADEDGVVPIFADDVTVMLTDDVLTLAGNFESPSIQRFKNGRYETD